MRIREQDVEVYKTPDGKFPFEQWINDLRDAMARSKIHVRIARLRLGNFGDCKAIGEGVHELRINYGPGYRVYFAHDGQKVVLLLCGGNKNTQTRDIGLAQEYWREYKS